MMFSYRIIADICLGYVQLPIYLRTFSWRFHGTRIGDYLYQQPRSSVLRSARAHARIKYSLLGIGDLPRLLARCSKLNSPTPVRAGYMCSKRIQTSLNFRIFWTSSHLINTTKIRRHKEGARRIKVVGHLYAIVRDAITSAGNFCSCLPIPNIWEPLLLSRYLIFFTRSRIFKGLARSDV